MNLSSGTQSSNFINWIILSSILSIRKFQKLHRVDKIDFQLIFSIDLLQNINKGSMGFKI